jgi:hypothetical protein
MLLVVLLNYFFCALAIPHALHAFSCNKNILFKYDS